MRKPMRPKAFVSVETARKLLDKMGWSMNVVSIFDRYGWTCISQRNDGVYHYSRRVFETPDGAADDCFDQMFNV